MFKTPRFTNQVDNFVMARWYHQQHQGVKLNTHDNLWPSSEEFFHPWNPAFADFCQTKKHLELYPMLLLRDGAHSLLDFFLRFPEPTQKSSHLIVHADISFLVPDAWRATTKCFRIIPQREYKPTNKLLFYHLLNEPYHNKIESSEKLSSWLEKFPKDSEVELFMCIREKLYNKNGNERRDCFDIMADIQHYFQNRVKILEFDEFKQRGADSNSTYINMDRCKSSISFCSIDSYMMSNSCQIFPQAIDKDFKGNVIDISPISFNHDLVLYDFINEGSVFNHLKSITDFSRGSEALPFPLIPELNDILQERLLN
jgi:hypothetical protein